MTVPLLDHSDPQVEDLTPWQSFDSFWVPRIASDLNRRLLPRYRANIRIHLGPDVEADVAEFAQEGDWPTSNGPGEGGVAVHPWVAPPAVASIPAIFPDDLEVTIAEERGGRPLVAVVELVSPRNKDRAEARRAFAAKCAAYLQRGIGLVVIDFVTWRRFNLHNELLDLLSHIDARMPDRPAYTVSYRPVHRAGANLIDLWPHPLTVGQALPTVPLALRGGPTVPLDLEATYAEACRDAGLG